MSQVHTFFLNMSKSVSSSQGRISDKGHPNLNATMQREPVGWRDSSGSERTAQPRTLLGL